MKVLITGASSGIGKDMAKIFARKADELVLAGESLGVVGNSYLNPGDSYMYYWTMSPAVFNLGRAAVWRESEGLNYGIVDGNFAVRPVINVITDNGFTSGDGTAENAYVIS